MSSQKERDDLRAKAEADKRDNLPPPPTLATQEEANIYDLFRNPTT